VTKIIIDGDKAKIQYYLRVPPDGRTQEVEVLPIEPFGGPSGTIGKTPTMSVGALSGGTGMV
jgi:hypothetical protein